MLKCGLRINLGKCELYISPLSKDGTSTQVNEVTIHTREHLNIMGLSMHVRATTCELLAGLLGRARDVFWKNKQVLRAKTPCHNRLRLIEKVVAGAGLWCISAFYPGDLTLAPREHMSNATGHYHDGAQERRGRRVDNSPQESVQGSPRGTLAGRPQTLVYDTGFLWAIGSLLHVPTSAAALVWRIAHVNGGFVNKRRRNVREYLSRGGSTLFS